MKYLIKLDLGIDGASFLNKEFTKFQAEKYMVAWCKRLKKLNLKMPIWKLVPSK